MTKSSSKRVSAAPAPVAAVEESVESLTTDRRLLLEQLTTADRMRNDATTRLREITALMTRAVRAEQFVEAETLKGERNAVSERFEAMKLQVQQLREKLDDNQVRFGARFFSEVMPEAFSTPTALTRVVVADPVTRSCDSTEYLESGDTIQLNVNGEHFESDAHHVDGWARDKGFLVTKKRVDIHVPVFATGTFFIACGDMSAWSDLAPHPRVHLNQDGVQRSRVLFRVQHEEPASHRQQFRKESLDVACGLRTSFTGSLGCHRGVHR